MSQHTIAAESPELARQSRLATSAEIAAYLRVPDATLKQWRYLRKGPAFLTVGRYKRYDWADVIAWQDRQRTGGVDDVAA